MHKRLVIDRFGFRPRFRVIGGKAWRIDPFWFRSRMRFAAVISLAVHACLVGALLIRIPRPPRQAVRFNSIPVNLVRLSSPSSIAGGRAGGGGGIRTRIPPPKPDTKPKAQAQPQVKGKPKQATVKNALPIPNRKLKEGRAQDVAARDSTKAGPILHEDLALAGGAKGSLDMTVDGPISAYAYYLMTVRDKVASNWEPPAGIVTAGKEVAAVINFRIDRSGKVTASYIEEPSGTGGFDAASLRAVILSSPLPPLPQEYAGDWLGIHLRFVYNE